MYYIRQKLQKRHSSLAFVKKLQHNPERLSFTKDIRQLSIQKTFIPDSLDNCKVVWLRVDRVKQPLEVPYTGPHELIKINKNSSTATIKKSNYHIIVSIQRLKPCTISFDREKNKVNHLHSPIVPTDVYYFCQQPYNREMIAKFHGIIVIAYQSESIH